MSSFPFKKYPELAGHHAFLSASKYHWINYDDEKLLSTYSARQAALLGDRKHELAKEMILLGIKPENTGQTFNMYVNDAIGYGMTPEQVLFYSANAFGTADAIDFRTDSKLLRIFDLKTGVTPASTKQLKVYAAFFCLQYGIKPMEIIYDLRLYQLDDIIQDDTDPEEIVYIMSRIVEFDKIINEYKGV